MKRPEPISLVSSLIFAVWLCGCATEPKKLEPIRTPPPQSQLLKGLDVVQQPELEPDWADFVKQHYPLWRRHYWGDRGQWGNRGYLVGGPPTNVPPTHTQMTPAPPVPQQPVAEAQPPVTPPVIIETPPPKTEPPAKPKTYTVRKGDSLWRIAGRIYGNPFRWPRIYEANKDKIKNPNRIYPGQVLRIP
ncbi:MAG: LysM peptidoglycan-binding domain-containing protein [Verrucomicrobiae bacterium]|nr:LysM peptidoglycan-binding domain-containing protein [Verrucomicrobiae bacterium]